MPDFLCFAEFAASGAGTTDVRSSREVILMNKRWGYSLLIGGLCGFASAQTQVSLRTQAKSVDLSAIGPTKPMQTGAALPGMCGTGEMFF